MSNVAHKNSSPPGSWPCNKGESGGESAPDQALATPRSPPAVPEYQGFPAGGSSVDESQQSGDYTHQDPNAERQEETTGKDQGEEEQQPIEMEGNTGAVPEGEEEEEQSIKTKDVEPKPEEETGEKGPEEEDTEKTVKGGKAPGVEQQSEEQGAKSEKTAENASLTEKAKQAFDQASQNQPTTEARDSFLQAARGSLKTPKDVEESASPLPQEEEEKEGMEEQQGSDVETSEKSGALADTQAKAETEPEEGLTEKTEDFLTTKEEAAPESEEKAAVDTQEAAPGTEEKAASEATAETKEEPGLGTQEGEQAAAETEAPAEAEATAAEEEEEEEAAAKPDFTVLKNGTVNKGGNVVSEDNKIVGRVIQGILKHLIGKKVDENGDIWSSAGKVVGKAEPIPDDERDEAKEPAPFESFPDAVVDKDGMVVSNGELVGRVVQGELSVLRGRSVDPDGDILDKGGNVIGKAERWEPEPEEEPEPEPAEEEEEEAAKPDFIVLKNGTVNKGGNVVSEDNKIVGRVIQGILKHLIGKKVDENGDIWSSAGKVVGKAEPIPDDEHDKAKELAPFKSFPDTVIDKDGIVVSNGELVGRVV
jgi:hypothetical protein